MTTEAQVVAALDPLEWRDGPEIASRTLLDPPTISFALATLQLDGRAEARPGPAGRLELRLSPT